MYLVLNWAVANVAYMTFYKLWTGRAADTPEEVARYFEDDVEYVAGVAEQMGIDIQQMRGRADNCSAAIQDRSPDRLNPSEKQLIASIFVGDAEWNEPLAQWLPWISQRLMMVTDGLAREKALEIARRYGSLENIAMPAYSTPANCSIDGDNPVVLLDIPWYRVKEQAMKRSVIACSILDLEWFVYICRQNDIDLDGSLVERTRQQSLAYFTGQRAALDEDVRKFQRVLFRNAAEWIIEVKEDFNMRSFVLQMVVNRFESVLTQDLGAESGL